MRVGHISHWHPDQPTAPTVAPDAPIYGTPVKSAVTPGATQDAAFLSGARKEEAKVSAVPPFLPAIPAPSLDGEKPSGTPVESGTSVPHWANNLTADVSRVICSLEIRGDKYTDAVKAVRELIIHFTRKLERDLATANTCIAKMREALEGARRKHYYCEDSWYSCPKHPEGCCDDNAGTACNCGADEVNATIDAALALNPATVRNEPAEPEQQNYREADDCPTEGAVLKREWRSMRNELAAKDAEIARLKENPTLFEIYAKDRDTLRAEVERLTEDRDKYLALVVQAAMH